MAASARLRPVIGPVDPHTAYTAVGLADLLGVRVQSIYNRRSNGGSLPAGHVVAGHLVFTGQAILDWLAGR